MKNNLFYYATSELSQDAFLCWLASFALEESSSDPVLKDCARHLIAMFVPELAHTQFTLVDVERQVGHIDVLLTVKSGDAVYKIILEDKTFTSEHSNQLVQYMQLVKTCFPGCRARGVYYKTGFQCDLSNVEQAGYTIISREQMLRFMSPYASQTSNQIFLDYYAFWSEFQRESEEYRTRPVSCWNRNQASGFYDFLKTTGYLTQRGLWMDYGYVANQTGGFYGLWAGTDDHRISVKGIPFELYLQLEISPGEPTSAQLCLKLSAQGTLSDKNALRAARDHVIYKDDWSYKLEKFNFRKPKRLALGRHMTIGVLNAPLTDRSDIERALDRAARDYKTFLSTLK